MAQQQPDYYALLGIGRTASATEIDRAYRRAARATHPDIHPDDTSAAERFNAVTIARETLSNPLRRASYDRAHAAVNASPPVLIVVRQHAQTHSTPPVHLGRRQSRPEQLRPFPASAAAQPPQTELHELITALSRLIDCWPFR